MHIIDSEQYGTPCVVAARTDTADAVMARCQAVGAIRDVDGLEYVVQLRSDVGPELWTDESLRRSLTPLATLDDLHAALAYSDPRTTRLYDRNRDRKANVFTGHTPNPDSPDEWANCLTLQATDGENAAGELVALVKVETNYKPHGRLGNEYPVNLTLSDAVKAAAALLAAVTASLTDTHDKALDGRQALSLLNDLHRVDDELFGLRTQLVSDVGISVGARVPDTATTPSTDAATPADGESQ